jgi:hypothetical protein
MSYLLGNVVVVLFQGAGESAPISRHKSNKGGTAGMRK